jgi:fibronectin type 3 domain-containing protein
VVADNSVPAILTKPAITGVARVGESLSVDRGVWSGGGTLSFDYQWLRCDEQGQSCAVIANETTNSYVLVAADAGHKLVVRVTATNTQGSGTATTDPSAVVADNSVPAVLTKPAITGVARVGESLSVDRGVWSGGGTLSFDYQWLRCDEQGQSCAVIANETTNSYVLVAADAGHRIAARVTATNSQGSGSAMTDPSAVVVDNPGGGGVTVPAILTKPAITGVARVGESLSVDRGVWSGGGTLSFDYQWLRCDDQGQSCVVIANETTNSYVLAAADAGHKLVARVTATNTQGSGSATSDPSAVVADNPGGGGVTVPVVTTKPVITGVARVGESLSVDRGVWSGNGTLSFDYQWLRCDSAGASCTAIANATTSSYALVAADAGHRIAVRVTATNTAGSGTATSDPTAAVASDDTVPPPGGSRDGRDGKDGRDGANGRDGSVTFILLPNPFPQTPITAAVPFRVRSIKFIKKNRSLVFAVDVIGPGKFSALASRRLKKRKTLVYGRKTVASRANGRITVRVKPGKKARTALKKAKKLKLAVTLSFTGPGGRPYVVTRSLTITQPKTAAAKAPTHAVLQA